MSKGIERTWYNVKKFLPGKDLMNNGMPVRCINRDECTDFYFMAYYRKDGRWDFFDDDDLELQKQMQVTHWCAPIELDDYGVYEGEDKRDNSCP